MDLFLGNGVKAGDAVSLGVHQGAEGLHADHLIKSLGHWQQLTQPVGGIRVLVAKLLLFIQIKHTITNNAAEIRKTGQSYKQLSVFPNTYSLFLYIYCLLNMTTKGDVDLQICCLICL